MKEIISTSNAPGAIGPYSQGCVFNGLLFTSGQIPLDPETGVLVEGGIEAETERCLKNIQAILAARGCSMDNVLKTTVYLTDMKNFAAMNGVYAKFFTAGNYPARSAVEVGPLAKGALVEIEAIAAL